MKFGSIIAGLIFLVVCAYYMLHRAFWLPGDEAIIMNATGWGHAFIPPREPFSIGRFFPFSYSLYNVLLLMPHGAQIGITNVYALQACGMFMYAVFIGIFCLQIMKELEDKWRYPITLLAVVFAVSRIYNELIMCYTAVWMVFSLLPIFLWCTWKFSETQKTIFAVFSLLIINYIIYCYETVFTIPITIGACALIFNYKQLTKKDIVFYSSLVASAVLFLLLYVVLVIPQTQVAYDGAHGSDVTLIGNAIHIFIAQKTMWIVAIILAYRVYDCIRNKQKFCFFDYLLLASCAYCCGAAALKLNFVYYYNAAVIVAIPAILYFGIHYLKQTGALIIFIVLASFYAAKLPKIIRGNQKSRKEYKEYIERIATCVQNGDSVYWYLPENAEMEDFDFEGRAWRYGYTQSGIGWVLIQENYKIQSQDDFTNEPGLWFVVDSDTTSFIKKGNYTEILYAKDGMKCYRVTQD